jgi:hypothetical protein
MEWFDIDEVEIAKKYLDFFIKSKAILVIAGISFGVVALEVIVFLLRCLSKFLTGINFFSIFFSYL